MRLSDLKKAERTLRLQLFPELLERVCQNWNRSIQEFLKTGQTYISLRLDWEILLHPYSGIARAGRTFTEADYLLYRHGSCIPVSMLHTVWDVPNTLCLLGAGGCLALLLLSGKTGTPRKSQEDSSQLQ